MATLNFLDTCHRQLPDFWRRSLERVTECSERRMVPSTAYNAYDDLQWFAVTCAFYFEQHP